MAKPFQNILSRLSKRWILTYVQALNGQHLNQQFGFIVHLALKYQLSLNFDKVPSLYLRNMGILVYMTVI
jgi:hypothetical protein